MWATILSIFTSGAGGGIVGGILALFKTAGERKERLELAKLELQRDQEEYKALKEQRDHEAAMQAAGAAQALAQAETEGNIAADIQNSKAKATGLLTEFAKLQTSQWVDNIRGLVRPLLVLWAVSLFSAMFVWAFGEYSDMLTKEDGKEILMGMFLTLNFSLNAIVQFYFVARSNSAVKR